MERAITSLNLEQDVLAEIDRRRGIANRSAFVNELLRAALDNLRRRDEGWSVGVPGVHFERDKWGSIRELKKGD